LQLFLSDKELIIFKDQMYLTDNPNHKKFLDSHISLGRDFWKDKFPEKVIRKFEDDKKYLTRDKEMFTPAEA